MISIYCGKVEDLLSNFRSGFFDACLCDPPYGLKFMGKSWDHGVPSKAIWEQVKRTLKPGAPILAFGGTRTFHRLACAIEDAGFEIFDSVLGAAWIYGQGFPKSLDIGKAIDKAAGAKREVVSVVSSGGGDNYNAWRRGEGRADRTVRHKTGQKEITVATTDLARIWDGYGTALKPAWEPVVCARKPLSGTYAENCIEHGCGVLNIDGSRIGAHTQEEWTRKGMSRPTKNTYGTHQGSDTVLPSGRYPANLILSHHLDCDDADGCHPGCPVAALDRQSGIKTGGKYKLNKDSGRKAISTVAHNPRNPNLTNSVCNYGDSGGASRFFYCAKVSTRERNAGLPADLVCDHPTLKPIDLCRYLATLILPPARDNQPRNLIIPFAGAGSEIIGATIAGWESISAIEKEYPYIEQAWYRIKSRTGIEPVIFD